MLSNYSACIRYGLKEPLIQEKGDFVDVELYRETNLKDITGSSRIIVDGSGKTGEQEIVAFVNDAGKTTRKTTRKTTQKTTQKTTRKTAQKIIDILKQNPSASRKEITEIFGNITEDGVKYLLNKLKKEGKIKRIGPDRGGQWEVTS